MGATRPLVSVLADCVQACEALLELARQKREVLLAGDADALATIVADEQVLLDRLARAERERRVTSARDPLPAGEREQVRNLEARLQQLLQELRRVGVENVALLQQALRYVQFSLRVLGQVTADVTYGIRGQVDPSSSMSSIRVMDQRV